MEASVRCTELVINSSQVCWHGHRLTNQLVTLTGSNMCIHKCCGSGAAVNSMGVWLVDASLRLQVRLSWWRVYTCLWCDKGSSIRDESVTLTFLLRKHSGDHPRLPVMGLFKTPTTYQPVAAFDPSPPSKLGDLSCTFYPE